MSNIEEMEKKIEHLKILICGEPDEIRYEFFMMLLEELKSQADRMARIEKQLAELIKDEENIKVGGTD